MLILGASGKLGRALRSVWRTDVPEDYEISPVFRSGNAEEQGLVWQPGAPMEPLPRADVVLALWGVSGGNPQALSANTTLARAAIALGDAVGAGQVLHCSSAAVYGCREGPLREAMPCSPANAYGEAKCAMEQAIADAPAEAGQTILRIGNVAGADMLFANLRPGETVVLDRFGSGRGPARSCIAPTDLGRAILALARAGRTGTVNVAAPRPTAMADIARAAGCPIEWRDAPAAALEAVHLDTRALSETFPLPDHAAEAEHLVADARRSGIWP